MQTKYDEPAPPHPSNPNQTASEYWMRRREWERDTGLKQEDVREALARVEEGMQTKYDELAKLSETATPGPWCKNGRGEVGPQSDGMIEAIASRVGSLERDEGHRAGFACESRNRLLDEYVAMRPAAWDAARAALAKATGAQP